MLVVANGGIYTHPDSGRTKLNIATMKPNLSYVQNGTVTESVELPPEMHKNSIRHLAVSQDGQVAFGMQWQGESVPLSLVGHHSLGGVVTLSQASPDQMRDMQGYVGSVAYVSKSNEIVVTSPIGGRVQFYDVASNQIKSGRCIDDVCGIAATREGFVLTSGTGGLETIVGSVPINIRTEPLHWDNHLVPASTA